MIILSKDVYFNKHSLLKTNENLQALFIDKEKFLLTDVIVKEFDHYVAYEMQQTLKQDIE